MTTQPLTATEFQVPVQVCARGCGFWESEERSLRGSSAYSWWRQLFQPRTRVDVTRVWRSRTCPHCGSDLENACPECRRPILNQADSHCRSCGRWYFWALNSIRKHHGTRLDLASEDGGNELHSFGAHKVWTWEGDLRVMAVDAVVVTDDELGYMRGEVAEQLKNEWGDDLEVQSVAQGPHALGSAWSTTAGPLAPVDVVIHCGAMDRDDQTSRDIIASATSAALREAELLRLHSVAFSALGTGAAQFPMEECGEVMADEFARFFETHPHSAIHNLVIVLFDEVKQRQFVRGFRERLPAAAPAATEG